MWLPTHLSLISVAHVFPAAGRPDFRGPHRRTYDIRRVENGCSLGNIAAIMAAANITYRNGTAPFDTRVQKQTP